MVNSFQLSNKYKAKVCKSSQCECQYVMSITPAAVNDNTQCSQINMEALSSSPLPAAWECYWQYSTTSRIQQTASSLLHPLGFLVLFTLGHLLNWNIVSVAEQKINALIRRLELSEVLRAKDTKVRTRILSPPFTPQYCPPPQGHQESRRLTQLPPESELTTADAPTRGNTTTPLRTSSATTRATATAAGNTATPNLPPPAVPPPPARVRKPATSRWEGTGL